MKIHSTPAENIAYLTECILATREYLLGLKRPSQHEIHRHENIAAFGFCSLANACEYDRELIRHSAENFPRILEAIKQLNKFMASGDLSAGPVTPWWSDTVVVSRILGWKDP